MVKTIRPTKILFGLRFKNRCIICGKLIPSDRMDCPNCEKKKGVF